MTAFFISHVTVKSPAKFQEYALKAGKTLQQVGATVKTKGKLASPLAGEPIATMVTIVEFSNLTTLNHWFESPEYQALIPLRDEAAEMVLTAYETV